jgi:hypothetical protein
VTLANIAIYLALIVFVIARRMADPSVGPVTQQFVLPVITVVTGWGDAAKGGTSRLRSRSPLSGAKARAR